VVDNSDISPNRDSTVDSPYSCFYRSSPYLPFQAARIFMALHVILFLLVVFLLSLALLWRLDWLHLQPSHSRGRAIHSITQRLLKPRTPLDCPACRLASTRSSGGGPAPVPVRPWREMKSRRGARHSGEHRGIRLSQPAVPILWDHRFSHPCGFSGMVSMARPSESRPFEVLLATPRSLPGAIALSTV
jgi:hypothetical protein